MKVFPKIWQKLKPLNFLGLTVAGIINALGVCLLLSPVNVYDGGFSGTSVLLDKNIPVAWLTQSVFLIVLNFPFFLLGRKKIGTDFLIYSLYAIAIYSLASFFFNDILIKSYIAGGGKGSPVVEENVILGAIFGGLLSGVGSGLVIKFGGALDGVEVMALLFNKKLGLSVGTCVMIYNAGLYIIAALLPLFFGASMMWEATLYSLIAYFVCLKTIDFIVEGLEKGKAALIITENIEELASALSQELKRGITVLDATGYYSGEGKKMLYMVVNRFEIAKLKAIVAALDPKSFVSIIEVSEIMGTGKMYRKKVK
ncbi:MAG: YitT family protein [Clostridia bacterium]|nr:YitT family protein [Clostridia bacterium]